MTKQKGRVMKDTVTVRSNFAELVTLKFKEQGEEVNITRIADETGLAVGTVRSLMRGGGPRFDGHTIGVLCRYLNCRIEDLLKIVDPTRPDASGGESDNTDD